MHTITKIINNNIVSSKDKNGEEIILRGLGIGFKKELVKGLHRKLLKKYTELREIKTPISCSSFLMKYLLNILTYALK